MCAATVLQATGYQFRHPTLASALRHVLGAGKVEASAT
jgi:Domain of unknown function (DUF1731)